MASSTPPELEGLGSQGHLRSKLRERRGAMRQELMYYLWHHVGRRARQGAAMNAPDYAHWHGFFQVFQVYQDMENIYNKRLKTGKVEEYSPVISSAPY